MGPRILSLALLALLSSSCEPVSVTGAWCQFPADCHRPNVCSLSRCRPPCTTASDCATSLCLAGHCAVDQDQGCTTIPGRTCASALTCAEDRCTLRCTTSCANGATCRPASGEAFSICVAPGAEVPDGGVADQ
jgi:hypothetical protein